MSVKIPPDVGWVMGFAGLTIPCLLLTHLFFIGYWLRSKRRKRFWLSFLALLLGYPFLQATISVSLPSQSDKQISVLSYNVRVFNVYKNDRKKDYSSSVKGIEWVAEDDSDIKCLQEFFNNSNSSFLDATAKIGEEKKYYSFVNPVVVNRIGAQFGLAIFSKYPIVHQGMVHMQEYSTNSAIFADITVAKDTIRIYNAHLASMSFDEDDIQVMDDIRRKSKNIARRLKKGFVTRTKQVRLLAEHIARSPYPVILCTDLNETPYSYAYFLLNKQLKNTFEAKGNGFGFSYNGPLFFLRIDHQFYSPTIKAQYFHTDRSAAFSDHFPLKAGYSF